MAPLIQLRSVQKTYHTGDVEVHALRALDLTIDQGEFVAIMGASGSGKSTLMNILGCLDQPTQGQYLLDGQSIETQSRDKLAKLRNQFLGFVFQGFHLLPRTSAIENVELPLMYAGINASSRRQQAERALSRVGLGERMDHLPNQLSGGQQQRVAIARAIVHKPKLILADEPTGNLDSKTSEDIMKIFSELHEEGMTVLLVTHEADIAAYARRLIVMRDGRILEDTPKRAVA